MLTKKKEFEFQDSDCKLKKKKKTSNALFNVLFVILAAVCIIPVVFVFMI